MTVLTDCFGLVTSGRKIIEKNRSLVEGVEVLYNMVTDKKSSGEGVEKDFA